MILGYALCNDVSEREFQAERGGQWIKGKSAPTFGPLGPVARHPRRDRRPAEPRHVPGRQWRALPDGQHKTMIFTVAHIVSYVSQFMALEPGDIITTGHAARCRHGA